MHLQVTRCAARSELVGGPSSRDYSPAPEDQVAERQRSGQHDGTDGRGTRHRHVGAHPGYGEARDALIQAAVRAASRQGVRRLTYRAVAAEAQVTHGTVQHHFGTLDALLEAALDYCVELSIRTTLLSLDSDDISDFVADLPDAIRATLDAQAYQYELILESRRRPELRPYVERYYASYHAAVAQALQQLHLTADPSTVDLVFSTLDGLVFRAVALGEDRISELEGPLGVLRQTLQSLQEQQPLVPGDGS